ncbi:MAG TPA: hypothetical protein P5277_01885 [Candidatus Paceibacterota bacterium]|nr:hypothetical protein [Candidatus Paceibacterota bacterium]
MVDSASKIIESVLEKTLGKNKKGSLQSHEITYDSPSETLEPVYFWILDMMDGIFGGNVQKISDNFSATPASGYFSELGIKKTQMQKNVTETMSLVNNMIRSIINIVYDLKDFEIRLSHYDAAKSKDKNIAEAGNLALKQIWMDNVDIKKGQGSINGMASGNLMFVTLRDAFLYINSVEDVQKADLNERVKRILEPRIAEYLKWKELSEIELRKRFSIEKNYLKSQVNSLKLYSRWVRPYLNAATNLEMKEDYGNPALVNAFSTVYLELTLMGRREIDYDDAVLSYQISKKTKKPKRKYYSVVVIDFKFRGIPQKVGQNYALGGRVNLMFKAYAMNDEELKVFDQEMKKADINDVLKLIDGSTTESLDVLRKEIEYFINDEKEEKKEEKKSNNNDNPFSALFSFLKKDEKKEEKKDLEIDVKKLKKDNYAEGLMRELAGVSAKETCFSVYDVYKKAHGMASHDSPFE